MGRSLELAKRPLRLVSLVPSQSEFLWDLGLHEQLVGITKFCVHPQHMFRSVTRVGGTKTPDLGKIRALKPDLIIGNKEENDQASIDQLAKEFPVWMSDISSVDQAYEMMQELGRISGREKEAESLLAEVNASLRSSLNLFKGERVAYLIWKEPLMLAGGNTFINSLLEHIGLHNVAAHWPRYPQLNIEALRELKPELCFLSSEPFPFKEKQAKQFKILLPDCVVRVVDGEVFSWYGSRLRYLYPYLNQLKQSLYA